MIGFNLSFNLTLIFCHLMRRFAENLVGKAGEITTIGSSR